jgi:predicted nuclease of predicted toxin-antitoxin system
MAHLTAQGHDVVSALAVDPRASDEFLLDFARSDDRILVTEDKDFGELVFVRNLPHGPIVRLVELSVDEQVGAISELLERYPKELSGAVIATVALGHIRIRQRVV